MCMYVLHEPFFENTELKGSTVSTLFFLILGLENNVYH